ncbi:hypothetical protein HDU83_001192 [Entophlyctis luteolus]|nr:hypothetical protein HDU82_003455 [Entophlyctis luteolus]KAJ3356401.1 hypothetical protein HDU83_001192 [Entophlyctis luteolus]
MDRLVIQAPMLNQLFQRRRNAAQDDAAGSVSASNPPRPSVPPRVSSARQDKLLTISDQKEQSEYVSRLDPKAALPSTDFSLDLEFGSLLSDPKPAKSKNRESMSMEKDILAAFDLLSSFDSSVPDSGQSLSSAGGTVGAFSAPATSQHNRQTPKWTTPDSTPTSSVSTAGSTSSNAVTPSGQNGLAGSSRRSPAIPSPASVPSTVTHPPRFNRTQKAQALREQETAAEAAREAERLRKIEIAKALYFREQREAGSMDVSPVNNEILDIPRGSSVMSRKNGAILNENSSRGSVLATNRGIMRSISHPSSFSHDPSQVKASTSDGGSDSDSDTDDDRVLARSSLPPGALGHYTGRNSAFGHHEIARPSSALNMRSSVLHLQTGPSLSQPLTSSKLHPNKAKSSGPHVHSSDNTSLYSFQGYQQPSNVASTVRMSSVGSVPTPGPFPPVFSNGLTTTAIPNTQLQQQAKGTVNAATAVQLNHQNKVKQLTDAQVMQQQQQNAMMAYLAQMAVVQQTQMAALLAQQQQQQQQMQMQQMQPVVLGVAPALVAEPVQMAGEGTRSTKKKKKGKEANVAGSA